MIRISFSYIIVAIMPIATTILMLSCTDNIVDTESEQLRYYPLHVGNTWYYNTGIEYPQLRITVIGKEMINEIEYFQIRYYNYKRYQMPGMPPELIIDDSSDYHERVNGQKVYKLQNNVERLVLDFGASIGEVWQQTPLLRTAEIVSRQDTVTMAIGQFFNCVHVLDESELDESHDWYGEDIGRLRSEFEFKAGASTGSGTSTLKLAIINGDTIQ